MTGLLGKGSNGGSAPSETGSEEGNSRKLGGKIDDQPGRRMSQRELRKGKRVVAKTRKHKPAHTPAELAKTKTPLVKR